MSAFGRINMMTHARACFGKERHKSQGKAEAAARAYQIKFSEEMNAYPCKYCKQWHIGHAYK